MADPVWYGGAAQQLQGLVAASLGLEAGLHRSPLAANASGVAVERFEAADCAKFEAPWRALADRALEANLFLDPIYAGLAARHAPQAERPEFLAVWRAVGVDPRGRMIGLFALNPQGPLFARALARCWIPRHGALGAPLLDRDEAGAAIDAALDWIAARRTGCLGLEMPRVPRHGPTFAAFVERCAAQDRQWSEGAIHERAMLTHGQSAAALAAATLSKKRRKEINRRANRLRDLGRVTFGTARAPDEAAAAAEHFLALEARGWKGRRGTALLCDSGDAAFTRALVRLTAREETCRIDWIALEGAPIAMGVSLRSARRSYYWKTAFDERYAAYSPGVLLTHALTERLVADDRADFTDSCAIADHPMIDAIWPERLCVADLSVCCDVSRPNAFEAAVQRVAVMRKLRRGAKYAAAAAFGYRIS